MLMVGDNEPWLWWKLYPNWWRTQSYYDDQIKQCEDNIEQCILKPTINSGHAFVCFETTEAANHFLQKFNTNVQNTCKLMCHAITDKFSDCFSN